MSHTENVVIIEGADYQDAIRGRAASQGMVLLHSCGSNVLVQTAGGCEWLSWRLIEMLLTHDR
jgi:hypothetical protein